VVYPSALSAPGRKILLLCLGEPAEGYPCSCTFFAAVLFMAVSFLCFPPYSSRLVAGVRSGPYHSVFEVRRVGYVWLLSLGWGALGLSHEEVKRVVGLFYGFVFIIASALYGFLYLNN